MSSIDHHVIRLNESTVARCYLISSIGAVVAIVSGSVGLLGWILGNQMLQSLFHSDIVIKANTAVGLILVGLILLLQSERGTKPPAVRIAANVLIALLIFVGAATLLEHLTGWDLKIDQLLFVEAPGAAATTSPGRMGPPASLAFTLAGISLLCQRSRKTKWLYVSQFGALLIGLISLAPLIGYVYGISLLYEMSRYTGIAFHTAATLVISSLSILCARPRDGMMRTANADDAGGQMCRRLIFPVIIIPFVLGYLHTIAGQHNLVDDAFGRPVLILAVIISFVTVIWWNARAMSVLSREREYAEEGRAVNAERLRLAIEAGRFAPWEYHGDTDEMWTSPEYQHLLGLKPGKQTRPRIECVMRLHPEDRTRIDKLLRGAIAERKAYDVEYRIILNDGAIRWVASRGDVVCGENGNVLGLVGIAHDITARKNSEEALTAAKVSAEKAKETAEAANSAKDRFLASLSHELRTPLTPVLTTTQLLENMEGLSDVVREQIVMIRRNVQLETRLIDDLLDLTRISRGKLALETAPIDLHEQVMHVIDICRSDFEQKRITLKYNLDASQTTIYADSPRIQQILWNLLKNAVKFTPTGGTVTVQTRNPNPRNIEVIVQDTGIGIEPENISRIFDAFEQGSHTITRQFGGLGLGLAISKAVVDLHGGTLSVHSEGRGRGSTFTLSLPASDSPEEISVCQLDRASVDMTNLSVLLVEDHADTARAMTMLLKINGCRTALAVNVAQARSMVDENQYDLILSDLGLPDGTGYDLIRYASQKRKVRAIALSGFGMEEDQRRSREAGFLAHLTKPVDQQALLRAIQSAMQTV